MSNGEEKAKQWAKEYASEAFYITRAEWSLGDIIGEEDACRQPEKCLITAKELFDALADAGYDTRYFKQAKAAMEAQWKKLFVEQEENRKKVKDLPTSMANVDDDDDGRHDGW